MKWDKDRDWVLNLWIPALEFVFPTRFTTFYDAHGNQFHLLRSLPALVGWLNRKIWAWRTGYMQRCNLPLSNKWWDQHLEKFSVQQHEDSLLVEQQLYKNACGLVASSNSIPLWRSGMGV